MKIFRWFLIAFTILMICGAGDFRPAEVEESALAGFRELLEIWRAEDYEALFDRLVHPDDKGWDYFALRIVHASRRPACCWEQLQEPMVTAIDSHHAVISAKVGFEEEGVGTRFVTRDFPMELSDGVWKLLMGDVLELCRYNLQRVPNRLYLRVP